MIDIMNFVGSNHPGRYFQEQGFVGINSQKQSLIHTQDTGEDGLCGNKPQVSVSRVEMG
jgi:hypothetical protein